MKLNGNIYTAEKGNFIVRISDSFIMGESIDLGDIDTIDNYEERPYTEESKKIFYDSIGMMIDCDGNIVPNNLKIN